MANTLALIAFSGLIAAQFLSVIFAAQYQSGIPAERTATQTRTDILSDGALPGRAA